MPSSFKLGCALIVALTIAAYLPSLHCGFIWDDDDHLTNNPAMLSVEGLKQIWSVLAASRYEPLTLTSFWVQRRFWGLHPLPYHAVNLALQAANAVLLWMLLHRLQVRGAWVAAALWAIHPVNVDTVAWVSELKNTQSGLFFLLALLAFLRFEDGLRSRDYLLALACGAAGMLSKPSTVILPGAILLCAWWRRGRWTRNDLLRVTPFVMLAAGMSVLAIVEQRYNIERGSVSEWTLSAAQRLVLAGRAVWFYAAKLVWPTDICFIYPRWELQAYSVAAWLPLAGLVLVARTLWHFRRARWARAAIFGVGYYLVALLPVLGFCDIYFFRYSFVADHFQYLASIGLITLVVSAGVAVSERAGRHVRDLRTFAGAIVLLVLGVSTWRQTHVYQDPETLWRDTLAKNPRAWLAHYNLGVVLHNQGKTLEAMGHYEQALQIKPDLAETHYNWGNALGQIGQVEEAIVHYEQALRIKPHYAEAHHNLGVALARLGRIQEAINHWQEASQTDPHVAETYYNLGRALVQLGRTQEAMGQWQLAVQIKPDYVEAHYDLGVVLAGVGRVQEAMKHWEQALRFKPDFAEAQYNLGKALADQGRTTAAIEHYQKAMDLASDQGNTGLADVVRTRLKPYKADSPNR